VANKLMIVAHPDDEIIFGGAQLIREKGWKVVCVTNANNRIRAREFAKVMKSVGADYEMWNYRDTYSYKFDSKSLKKDLRRLIEQNLFQKVVTHSVSGEYGHPQHKVIASIVRNLVKRDLYVFSLGQRKLPMPLLVKKKKLLKMYSSQKRTIWQLSRDHQLNHYINNECIVRVK
jgi:LmbE family N-acetylglucosaminyl deacetylase